MSADPIHAPKKRYAAHLGTFAAPGAVKWRDATNDLFTADSTINIVHPFNAAKGPDSHRASVFARLLVAFDGHCPRVDILMGGRFKGGDWASAIGYWAGHFRAPFLENAPTGRVAHPRFGEFHRMADGRAVESYIFPDIQELIIVAGRWPLPMPPGHTGILHGPATQDWRQLHANDPAEGA